MALCFCNSGPIEGYFVLSPLWGFSRFTIAEGFYVTGLQAVTPAALCKGTLLQEYLTPSRVTARGYHGNHAPNASSCRKRWKAGVPGKLSRNGNVVFLLVPGFLYVA